MDRGVRKMADRHDEPSVIDEHELVRWLDARVGKLGDYHVGTNAKYGVKYLLNSPWKSDSKRHLAIIPFRGKYGRYKDFKSGKQGSVVDFVMEIDGLGFRDAKSLVVTIDDGYRPPARETQVDPQPRVRKSTIIQRWELKLPEGCIRITSDHAGRDDRLGAAYAYLAGRSMDAGTIEAYYCSEDRRTPEGKLQPLKHRILIAFRDWNDELWYWTARSQSEFRPPRYLEPTQTEGAATKEEVLYCPSWDIHGRAVLVCEGPIDARSVWLAGFPAVATQGSNWYLPQQQTLREFAVKPIFAFDNDEAGIKALHDAAKMWGDECFFAFAPEGEDWNSALRKLGVEGLRRHILENVALVDERTMDMLAWNAGRKQRMLSCRTSTSKTDRRNSRSPRKAC